MESEGFFDEIKWQLFSKAISKLDPVLISFRSDTVLIVKHFVTHYIGSTVTDLLTLSAKFYTCKNSVAAYLISLYDWYRLNKWNRWGIKAFTGSTSSVFFMNWASVPEVLHIQQVIDIWWAINASNGYGVPIMPQSPFQVKCYQPRFIHPSP